MVLQQFERRLERLVEGTFGKALRGQLQPVEIGRRLTREMDVGRKVGVRGLIAPNHFDVQLSPADHERFEPFREALARELGEAAREHAKGEGYEFLGPVDVEIDVSTRFKAGRFAVVCEVREGADELAGAAIVQADGSRVVLGSEPVDIGRLPECGIVMADPNVSRRHAEIRRVGHEIVIVDLGSTNGTRVNGAPIRERKLADGDEITVGTTSMWFEAR